jgi:hypothetical protein
VRIDRVLAIKIADVQELRDSQTMLGSREGDAQVLVPGIL